ncbi:MAG: YitT family protein, partial [Deltaproteobacteria bacterium]|nr:YitT family protein [Deltaproteobacteria bacterium]
MQMIKWNWRHMTGSVRQVIWNLMLLTLGSVLCAAAINGILIPHQFFSGGFTGVALIIHYFFPSLPIWMLYFILNIPLYALGWMFVGRRFFLYSIAGVLIFSAALAWPYVSL